MQVSVETTSNIERRMTIGVPAQEIDQAVQKRLQETARTVRLNGFRPGKVPMSVVKRRFGDSIRQEVVGEAMRDNYIKEETITMVTTDRISAFDCVLGTVPFKGQALVEMADPQKADDDFDQTFCKLVTRTRLFLPLSRVSCTHS